MRNKSYYNFCESDNRRVKLFSSAVDVWFWFCETIKLRALQGVGGKRNSDEVKSCEINDVYRIVKHMIIQKIISNYHLEIMVKYGNKLLPPSVRFGDKRGEEDAWNEAMLRFDEVLKKKGIVENETDSSDF